MKARDADTTVSRQELENALRLRLQARQCEYRAAAADYQKLLQTNEPDVKTSLRGPLAIARVDASLSLKRYIRAMWIFSDLIVHRKVTEETYFAAFRENNNIPAQTHISIIDDDESVRSATRDLLRSAGYCVGTFASAQRFVTSGVIRYSACLVLDLCMPEIDGLELQRRLKVADYTVPIIFISAHHDPENQRKAMYAGAVTFFEKPFEGKALLTAIEGALMCKTQEAIALTSRQAFRTMVPGPNDVRH